MRFEIDVTKTIEVVLICSIAGGTGSGAFLQTARAIQALAGSRKINLTGYFYLPSIFENIPDGVTPEMFANARSLGLLEHFHFEVERLLHSRL